MKVKLNTRVNYLRWLKVNLNIICLKTLYAINNNYIIPFMIKDLQKYVSVKSVSQIAKKRINQIAFLSEYLEKKNDELLNEYGDVMKIKDLEKRGFELRKVIVPLMEDIRSIIDAYEVIADKEIFNLPTYADMLSAY